MRTPPGADYIVVEIANQILGRDWLPNYVDAANNGGINYVDAANNGGIDRVLL